MGEKRPVPTFSAQALESIAKVLGDTEHGLTGSEIGKVLADSRIPDTAPELTKWKRLYNALVEFQNHRQFGNHVVVLINNAMDPVRYTSTPEVFTARQYALNEILAFCGMHLGDDGKVRWAERARNLDEAMARADRLRAALRSRNVHPDVLHFCTAELVARNYFHAVFEAMKSVSWKIRNLSQIDDDGANLVDRAFGLKQGPVLAINELSTESQRGEQRGFSNLLKGLFGTVRNPLAHEAKITWDMSEQDALDLLTTISLVHRKLDQVRRLR